MNKVLIANPAESGILYSISVTLELKLVLLIKPSVSGIFIFSFCFLCRNESF